MLLAMAKLATSPLQLIGAALVLSRDTFGNYVVQHVLSHGDAKERYALSNLSDLQVRT